MQPSTVARSWVLYGKLFIKNTHTKCTRPPSLVTYQTALAGEEVFLDRLQCYTLEAGASGCMFIEGHKRLIPTVLRRLVTKGTMRYLDDEQGGGSNRSSYRSEDASIHTMRR